MKSYIYFPFIAALICGCVPADDAQQPTSVRIGPNVVMNLIVVDEDSGAEVQIGNVTTRTPYLCVQLEILDEGNSGAPIVPLSDFIESKRPFKGHERAVLQVHVDTDDQALVDVLNALKIADVEDIDINPCGGSAHSF